MNLALTLAPAFPRFALFRLPAPRQSAARSSLRNVAHRACLDMGNAEGLTISCIRGAVWLTHDGDCKDVVLQAGESHAITRRERLIAQGLEDSILQVA